MKKKSGILFRDKFETTLVLYLRFLFFVFRSFRHNKPILLGRNKSTSAS